MEWLNYHHLLYFWTVVEEGGMAAAGRKLGVGRPTISMQIKSLEAFFGSPLFVRSGRNLELTETGKLVHGYAGEIFHTGRELLETVRGKSVARPATFRVGVADVMAKLVASALLSPVLDLPDPPVLQVLEEHPTRLFAELAVHELDLVLSDIPLAPGLDVRAFNHLLGESTTTLFAAPDLAQRLEPDFPASLNGADFLMPSRSSAIRGALELWLDQMQLEPKLVGEFEDSALLKVFGQAGRGVFPAPTVVEEAVCAQYQVEVVSRLDAVTERFYAISPERKIKHPGVACIVEAARARIF